LCLHVQSIDCDGTGHQMLGCALPLGLPCWCGTQLSLDRMMLREALVDELCWSYGRFCGRMPILSTSFHFHIDWYMHIMCQRGKRLSFINREPLLRSLVIWCQRFLEGRALALLTSRVPLAVLETNWKTLSRRSAARIDFSARSDLRLGA